METKEKEALPKIIFWSEVDGKQVLTQYVEKSLNAIQDPKKLKALLIILFNQMKIEAAKKGIFGVLLTNEPITIGAMQDDKGEFLEIRKKVFFDFEPKKASKGIFFY